MTLEEASEGAIKTTAQVVQQVGYPIVISLATLYGGWLLISAQFDAALRQQEAASLQIDSQNKYIRDVLTVKVEQSTMALTDLQHEIAESSAVKRELCSVLQKLRGNVQP